MSLAEWIDPEDPALQTAADQTAGMLFESAQFPAAEWDRAASQATVALLEYLQEPAHALAEFAYPTGNRSVPANDLRRRTGYFSDYPYMARAVDAWLEQRQTGMVDRAAFESAMRHLDARMTDDHGTDQWMSLLQPMIDLVTFAGIQPVGLPVSMVTRFFEAKDRSALAALIQSAAAVHHAEIITVPSLREIIDKGLENERLRAAQAATATPEAPAPAAPDLGSATESAPAAASGGSDEQPLPLWKRFQQRVDHQSGAAGANESGTSPSGNPAAESGGQPLWKSFEKPAQGASAAAHAASAPQTQHVPADDTFAESPADEADSGPSADVPVQEAPRLEAQHIVLGTAVRSKDRFVRALFDHDEEMYREVMEELAEAPDWSSASAIIAQRIFKPYRIDIYSDVAVDFTNAVEARYSGMPS